MTNTIAVALAVVIVALVVADVTRNDAQALVFAGRRFADLIEYLAFWR